MRVSKNKIAGIFSISIFVWLLLALWQATENGGKIAGLAVVPFVVVFFVGLVAVGYAAVYDWEKNDER